MKKVCLALLFLSQVASAQFTLVFADAEGAGFRSTDAAIEAPGNTAPDLGAQRRAAAEAAIAVLRAHLQPAGPVEIIVSTSDLGFNTAASASPGAFHTNDPNLPLRDTTYPGALANHLAGRDLSPGVSEVLVNVNERVQFSLRLSEGDTSGRPHLATVLLHEILHGLGFRSNVRADGSYETNFPCVFTRQLFFLGLDQNYADMTVGARATAVDAGDLTIFIGPSTRIAARALHTAGPQTVLLSSPAVPERTFEGQPAQFGADVFADAAFDAPLALYDDGAEPTMDGCTDPTAASAQDLMGKIALMERGGCNFTEKAQRAQDAGAVGVVIINTISGLNFPGGSAPNVTIPVISARQTDKADLVALATAGERLRSRASHPGTSDGRPFIYTPRVFESGSSLSHWPEVAGDHLIMRPVTNNEVTLSPPLAFAVLRDLGWTVRGLPFPSEDYGLWASSFGVGTASDDADQDGFANLLEFAAASDPTNAQSRPAAADARVMGDQVEVTFPFNPSAAHESGISYQWTRRSDLQPGVGMISTQELQVGTPFQPAFPTGARFSPLGTVTLTVPAAGREFFQLEPVPTK